MIRTRSQFLIRLVAALFVLAALVTGARASFAQTISNTARATYSIGSENASSASNVVTFERVGRQALIDTYRPVPTGGTGTSVRPSYCQAADSGQGTLEAPGESSLSLTETKVLTAGEQLVFRFDAPAANRDPSKIDSLKAVITTDGGDRETIVIYETAPDSGTFYGMMSTVRMPPPLATADCRLSVTNDTVITIEVLGADGNTVIADAQVTVLADRYGYVFDSETGEAVNGARVTLIDVATGQPAQVFAPDGTTSWPSTMVTGEPVRDGAGNAYTLPAGEYWFPQVAPGTYIVKVEPPAPYSAPSAVLPEQLDGLGRPDGSDLKILDASYGKPLSLASLDSIEVDIPLDRPGVAVTLTKTASRTSAQPGDAVVYAIVATNADPGRAKRNVTLVDTPSRWLRLRPGSIRIDGVAAPDAVSVTADGRQLTALLGTIPAGGTVTLTYAMTVRADAPEGVAENRVVATDLLGNRSETSASLKIELEGIAGRMTIIGRISLGECSVNEPRQGLGGIRVMLEDGSFAVTDAEGRYHFEGVVPGTHVVQPQSSTLPQGARFIDCARNTRAAGKADSRFVTGQGGTLAVADFAVVAPEAIAPVGKVAEPTLDAESKLTAGDRDWIALGDGPDGFLFPDVQHNPRAPAVRAVVRHRVGQKVELLADGKPVADVAIDSVTKSPDGAYAVTVWSGIPIPDGRVKLDAVIRNADGSIANSDTRNVFFANQAARAEIVPALSRLIADGSTRPVVALRILDRAGRPVHDGVSGTLSINAPYESASALALLQTQQLTGAGAVAPGWQVHGDEGIALVELAPTMVSGSLRLKFQFENDDQRREQDLEAWIVPGDQKWTLVGIAEAGIGSRTIADQMERNGRFDSDLGDKARVALYAKGRVLGRFLVTASYDSAKQKDQQRLLGALDPQAYYTVFGDGSDRRYDAASREKLYVRIEAKAFYAIYGDVISGFDQTELARYQRTFTGVKAEYGYNGIHGQAFAARIGSGHRRDEIQGNGLTGPYSLSARGVIASSETVILEIRDRLRSNLIVSSRTLTRFVDYDIDLATATITFREPVLSRDSELNPQFIVVDYEIDGTHGGAVTAGARADVTFANDKVRLGASVITEKDGTPGADRRNLAAADLRVRPDDNTEVRAEFAASREDGEGTAKAWLVEVERHDAAIDLLAYARSTDSEFGLGQQNMGERGRRKIGLDARYALTERLSVTGRGWLDKGLDDGTSRRALELRGNWKRQSGEVFAGVTHFADTTTDGSEQSSTVLEGGVSQRLFENRLELTASGSVGLGSTGSVDLPARQRFSAAWALANNLKVLGTYEIASGDAISARQFRGGIEYTPWRGGRMTTMLGSQDIAEQGRRTFANFGFGQSVELSKHVSVDATLDGARTLRGGTIDQVVDPEHPIATGGQLSRNGLVEDFTAVTLGGTYRDELWSMALRGEYRDGEWADRRGVTLGVVRQLGDGRVLGGGFVMTRAESPDGAKSEIFDGSLTAAWRPAMSPVAALARLSYRSDRVVGGVEGGDVGIGNTVFTVTGNAAARRLLGSMSLNWTPRDHDDHGQSSGITDYLRRSEFELFAAVRYNFDKLLGYDLSSVTLLAGTDMRVAVGDKVELGMRGTVRAGLNGGGTSFAYGPHIGFTPSDDVLVMVGYNVDGFRDRDYAAARYTSSGIFVSTKIKLDANTFDFLGLSR